MVFLNADVSKGRLFRAVFLNDSVLSAGCGGGFVFISCRLGYGAVFSEAADDHP